MSRFSSHGKVEIKISVSEERHIEVRASLTAGSNAKLRIKLRDLVLDEVNDREARGSS
jgi:hypothetical protein